MEAVDFPFVSSLGVSHLCRGGNIRWRCLHFSPPAHYETATGGELPLSSVEHHASSEALTYLPLGHGVRVLLIDSTRC